MSRLEDQGFRYICNAEVSSGDSTGAVEMSAFGWHLLVPFAFFGVAIGAILVYEKRNADEGVIGKDALENALFEVGRNDPRKALDILYRSAGRKLEKKARYLAKNDADATDAVQELFAPGGPVEMRLREVEAGDLPLERFTSQIYGDLQNKIASVKTQEKARKLTSEKEKPYTDEEAIAKWRSLPPFVIDSVKYAPVPEILPDGSAIVRFTSSEGRVALTRTYKRPVHEAPKTKLILPIPRTEEGLDLEAGDRYREHLESMLDLGRALKQIGIPDAELSAITTEFGDVRQEAIAMLMARDPGLTTKKAGRMVDLQVEELRSNLMSQLGREGDLGHDDIESAKLYLRLGERAKKARSPAAARSYALWAKNIRDAFDRRLGEFAFDRAEKIAERLNSEEDSRRRLEQVIEDREFLISEGRFQGPIRPVQTFDLEKSTLMTPEERRRVAKKIAEKIHETEETLFSIDEAIARNEGAGAPEVMRLGDLRLAFKKVAELPKGGHVHYEGAQIGKVAALKKIQKEINAVEKKISEISNTIRGLETRKSKVVAEWRDLDRKLPESERATIESLQSEYRTKLSQT